MNARPARSTSREVLATGPYPVGTENVDRGRGCAWGAQTRRAYRSVDLQEDRISAPHAVSEEVELERNAPWLEQSIRSDTGRTQWMRSSRRRSRRASGLKRTPTRTRSSSSAAIANRSGAASASTAPAAATWYRSTSEAR